MKKNQSQSAFRFVLHALICCALSVCYFQSHAQQGVLIFPVPQQLQLTAEPFVLDESVSIVTPLAATPADIFLARRLVRELSDKYGIALKIENVSALPAGKKFILMGSLKNPLVKKYCTDHKLEVSEKNPGPEGYLLQVANTGIMISGSDDAGSFYGLQSLRQLLQSKKGNLIQGVNVRDWPDFPFRAIRLYIPGPENMPFFKRFLGDFMALYKYNKVVLELNCMRLDKHPEVNTGWIEFAKYMQYTRSNSTQGVHGEEKNSSHFDAGDGFIIEKDDVKEIVKDAAENFIEVIPEIPSLTHAYYLLTKHPELAEYPGDRWPDTYCPSNPKSYELMFDVYDEYIDVIKPKMVHIGHDEWWGAPVGVCPLCKGKDYSKLFAGDVNKIHGYFSKKNIKLAMWGDYLLESVRDTLYQDRVSSTGLKYKTPGAVRPEIVKQSIPKDILIFNWFWIDEEKEMVLDKFGFTQIYGNFTPNISHWSERTKKIHLAGGAPSSWAATNEANFGKDIMLDFLGCANLLWSPHTIKQIDMPGIVWELMPSIRSNLKAMPVPSADGDAVESVDISSRFNISKDSKLFNIDLSTLASGEVRRDNAVFNVGSKAANSGNCAIAVGTEGVGAVSLPGSITGISIGEDVSSLIFLHACAVPAGNQKAYFNIPNNFDSSDLLGWYEVVFEDGFKSIVPIRYGVNILEWNPGGEKSLDKREGDTGADQKAYCYEADPVDCSSDMQDNPISFFAFEWVNPRFGKKIKEINLYGSRNYQALTQDYGTPVTEPMRSNAILLAGISKVKKREPFKVK
jgi:hypothetical protein